MRAIEPTKIPKDRPLAQALFFLLQSNRMLFGASTVLFAFDALFLLVSRLGRHGVAIVLAIAALRAVFRGFLRPGFLRTLDGARRGYEVKVDDLTSGVDCFEKAIAVHLLTDLVVAASLVAGALPGFGLVVFALQSARTGLVLPGICLAAAGGLALHLYAYAGVRFAEHAVSLEQRGPLAALDRAWRLAHGRRLRILWAVLAGSILELLGLAWGLASFGIGIFLGVPFMRLAGDHLLLDLFAKAQADDRTQPRGPALTSGGIDFPFGSAAHARGAAMPEYALLIVVVMLVAGGAYRALGRSVNDNAARAASVLASGAGGAGGAGEAEGSGGGDSGSALAKFISDFADGFVRGDFSDRDGAGKVAGQIIGGLVPIYGQIADLRDIAAAVVDVANGKEGGWANLGMATVGVVPGVGDALKAGLKAGREARQIAKHGDEIAAAAAAAARRGEKIGEGATSIVYREGNNVRKVVKDEVAVDGGLGYAKITESERDFLAKNNVEVGNQLHDAMPGIVPRSTSDKAGEIVQPFVGGLDKSQLKGDALKNANQQQKDAIAKAEETLGLTPGGHGEYPDNGFLVKVDPNSANFRFDKDGNVTSWFDPVAIVPPKSRTTRPL